jgi:hypothetical protein
MAILDLSMTELASSVELLEEFYEELIFEQTADEITEEVRSMTTDEVVAYCEQNDITEAVRLFWQFKSTKGFSLDTKSGTMVSDFLSFFSKRSRLRP